MVQHAVNSNPRVLKILLLNLMVLWLMGAAIVRPPITEYTQSIEAYWENLPKNNKNIISAILS